MTGDSHDPRDIPILTDAIDEAGRVYGFFDVKSVHAAVVTETLNLADSLLHRAIKDIEATLFECVFDQLRSQLPELVDRILREHAMTSGAGSIGVTTGDTRAGSAVTAQEPPIGTRAGSPDASPPDGAVPAPFPGAPDDGPGREL
jgi:hypothetical protein